MSLSSSGYLLASGQGDGYRFFNALATLKAGGAETDDAFTLMEFTIPLTLGRRQARALPCTTSRGALA